MSSKLDAIDRKLLGLLQSDATLSVDALSDAVALSRNACWRRIRQMEEAGVIRGRVALLDPDKVGCPLQAMVMVRSSAHDAGWTERFHRAIETMPEVVGAYRMTGELDYLLRVRVADVPAYDLFYKKLTARVPLSDISASFVMEEMKDSTAIPL
ncbi:MAG: Lrp/AsnC family transcriptional regulator [Paracoccaceae bacterium]|nr:Lrp/AsnC family transcriptional regulator [Paracoccaceae bacterium]